MNVTRIEALRTLPLMSLGVVLFGAASGAAQNIAPPHEPGPFTVGVTTFSATMTAGRVARVQVYYPTLQPLNCQTTYTVLTAVGSYQLRSPLCAVQNGQAVPGLFPLIVHDHGGMPAGADFQRLSQLPVHETLASHGFVVAVGLHSADALNRVVDLPLVIDAMLARSATAGDLLAGTIDPERIGISGESTGGGTALRVAGGWSENAIAADPRIKAMVVYEPNPFTAVDVSTISVPYLVMGGTQYTAGLAIPDLFDATVLATPRIYVTNPQAVHISYQTGICSRIDETREAAWVANPMEAEPLTNLITLPTGRRVCNPALGAAASAACSGWNMGEITSPTVVGFGGGRNFCTSVGVNSVVSLDVNPADGLTDSPPFTATDALTLSEPIPGDIMVPMITHYTVAFWKKFLERDGRYMRYLTPGYARVHELPARVKIQD